MATLTFRTKDLEADKRIRNAFKGLFPIPEVPVDDEDPSKGTKPQYTDDEWVRLKIIEYVKTTVRRFEEIKAREEALNKLVFGDIIS